MRTLHKNIRLEADARRVLLVHGSPRRLNEYLFEDRPLSSFQRRAASSNAEAIAFGHTHKPYAKTVEGVMFVNDGSVGNRRTWIGAPVTRFARMAPYRFGESSTTCTPPAAAIRATDLPHEFAFDIESGGAPRSGRRM